MQQNNCYSQLNYNELPDTLFQEYKDEHFVEQVLKNTEMIELIPAKFKSSYKDIRTKQIYKDCNDCVYEEYIDSLEIRSSYDEIILLREVKYKYYHELRIQDEWAWVKMYEEIPKDHKPCLDVVGIDTCLWKYVIIQEAKIDTLLKATRNVIPDTIKISPLIIPIKKYRLKNKSSQEVEKLTLMDAETVSVGFYIIEEEAKIHVVDPGGDPNIIVRILKRLIKAVTPLNYDD